MERYIERKPMQMDDLNSTMVDFLPSPPLRAFSSVSEISCGGGKYGNGYCSAFSSLASFEWIFERHFVDDPVFPGSMMIDGLFQLAGVFGYYVGLSGKGRAVRVDGVKFTEEVFPGWGNINFRIDIKKVLKNKRIIIAAGHVAIDNRICSVCDELWIAFVH